MLPRVCFRTGDSRLVASLAEIAAGMLPPRASLALAIVASLALLPCRPAQAQSTTPREILLGVIGGSGIGGSIRVPPAAEQGSRSTDHASDPGAATMLADGLGRLGAGDQSAALRIFEQLVALFPDTSEASHARRYLGEAYRNDAITRVRPAAGPPTTALPVGATTPGQLPPAGATSSAPAPSTSATGNAAGDGGSGWRVSVRSDTALEHRLISEVGDRVFFASGSAEIGARAASVLVAEADWLIKQPRLDATIEGHADEPGSEVENLELSQARAEAVRLRLIAAGVAPERLTIAARGRGDRLAECAEPECAAQNRRVVLVPFTREAGDREGPLAAHDAARPAAPAPIIARRAAAADAPPPR